MSRESPTIPTGVLSSMAQPSNSNGTATTTTTTSSNRPKYRPTPTTVTATSAPDKIATTNSGGTLENNDSESAPSSSPSSSSLSNVTRASAEQVRVYRDRSPVYVASRHRTRSSLPSLQDELNELALSEQETKDHAPVTQPAAVAPLSCDTDVDGDASIEVLLGPMETSRLALEAEIERLQSLLSESPARSAMAQARQQIAQHQQQQQSSSSEESHQPPSHSRAHDSSPLSTPVAASASGQVDATTEPIGPAEIPDAIEDTTTGESSSSSSSTEPSSTSPSVTFPISSSEVPTKSPAHTHARRGYYIRPPPVSPTSLESWRHAPVRTLDAARSRVREREQTFRAYLRATMHHWTLVTLQFALVQLRAVRGSQAVRAALSLPFMRALIELGSMLTSTTIDWALHTRLFRMIPGSQFVHAIMADEELRAAWKNLPPLPEQEVLPLVKGPLRPLFKKLAHLPLSSLFFTIEPDDAPLAVEPVSSSSPSSSTTPAAPVSRVDHAIVSELLTRLESQAALIAFLEQDRRTLQATIERMSEARDLELTRLDEERHAATLEPHQQRMGLRNRRARGMNGGGTSLTINGGVSASSSSPFGSSHDFFEPSPTTPRRPHHSHSSSSVSASSSSSAAGYAPISVRSHTSTPTPPTPSGGSGGPSAHVRNFMSSVAESRMNELHNENIELRGLASAQESSLHGHELAIQALTEETEVLAERIYELEEQLEQAQIKRANANGNQQQ